MKIVNTGNIYRIYDDSLKTYDELPVGTYTVCFSDMSGFYLEKKSDIKITEKIYGVHMSKVEKIMKSFEISERNLGVILSGEKGIGKTLTAKILAMKSVEHNLPIICVDAYIPGIAKYISSIETECVVLFDEFDKIFKSKRDSDKTTSQDEMLSLFDGIDQGKKLFIVTCNNLYNLSDYLVNRPGRFHYHLRFNYPSADEIREYLNDKLDPKYKTEIDSVVMFSNITDLNYDCLRAIAFELNMGIPFKDAIKDLNITNYNDEYRYDVTCVLSNGLTSTVRNCSMGSDRNSLRFSFPTIKNSVYVVFNTTLRKFDYEQQRYIIDESGYEHIEWDSGYSSNEISDGCCDAEYDAECPVPCEIECESENKSNENQIINPKITQLILKRKTNYRDIHYEL